MINFSMYVALFAFTSFELCQFFLEDDRYATEYSVTHVNKY